jgi:hypothetical protein
MKTILHLHILIRLVAAAGMIYGVQRIVLAWPQFARLRKTIVEQREISAILGGEYEPASLLPSFTEVLLGPLLLIGMGMLAFLGSRTIVTVIIGRQQMIQLLQLDDRKPPIRPE